MLRVFALDLWSRSAMSMIFVSVLRYRVESSRCPCTGGLVETEFCHGDQNLDSPLTAVKE